MRALWGPLGLCPVCGMREKIKGYSKCDPCLSYAEEWNARVKVLHGEIFALAAYAIDHPSTQPKA